MTHTEALQRLVAAGFKPARGSTDLLHKDVAHCCHGHLFIRGALRGSIGPVDLLIDLETKITFPSLVALVERVEFNL